MVYYPRNYRFGRIGNDMIELVVSFLEPEDFLRSRLVLRTQKSEKLSYALENILAPESCFFLFRHGFELIFLTELVPQRTNYKIRNEILKGYLKMYEKENLEQKLLLNEYNNRMKVWKYQEIFGQNWNSFIVPHGYEKYMSIFMLYTLVMPKEMHNKYIKLRNKKWDTRFLWIKDDRVIYKKMIVYPEFDVRDWQLVRTRTGEVMWQAPQMAAMMPRRPWEMF